MKFSKPVDQPQAKSSEFLLDSVDKCSWAGHRDADAIMACLVIEQRRSAIEPVCEEVTFNTAEQEYPVALADLQHGNVIRTFSFHS